MILDLQHAVGKAPATAVHLTHGTALCPSVPIQTFFTPRIIDHDSAFTESYNKMASILLGHACCSTVTFPPSPLLASCAP